MLWWLIENTLLSVPLAGFAWLACRGLRLSPAVRHGLWLVVLLKLTSPPLFAWPAFSPPARLMAWLTADGTTAEAEPATQPTHSSPADDAGQAPTAARPQAIAAAPAGPSVLVEYEVFEVPRHGNLPPQVAAAALPPAPQSAAPTWRERLAAAEEPILAVWLLGVVAMAVVQWRRIARFRRLLAAALPAPSELVAETARLAERMGVRAPPLAIVPGLYSPSIWSLGRPKLLWPASLIAGHSLACLSGVVVHELAHLRRRDHWVGWLELAAACCWWWNPVFWLVARELRENAELACDAWVVMLLPDSRRAYARALIDVTQLVSTRPAPLPALGMAYGARHTFERRLTMILRDRVACQAPLWALLALGVLAVAVLPRWSAGQAPAVASESEGADDAVLDAVPEGQVEYRPVLRAAVGETVTFQATAPVADHAAAQAEPATAATDPAANALPRTPLAQATPAPADPDAYRQHRLEEMEGQLQRLLKDVVTLAEYVAQLQGAQNTPPSANAQPAVRRVAQLATVDADSGRVVSVETLPEEYVAQLPAGQPAPATATQTAPTVQFAGSGIGPIYGPVDAMGVSALFEPGVEVLTLTRAKYKLAPARADAMAQLLSNQLSGEVEVRIENGLLVITTTPESQQAIGAFLQFLGRFPASEAQVPLSESETGGAMIGIAR